MFFFIIRRKMKKIFFGIFALLFFFACDQENAKHEVQKSDSLALVAEEDSILPADLEVKHPEADGLFDDFIYLFMQDKSLQFDRIQFPLKWTSNGDEHFIEKNAWVYDSIYLNQSETTLIVDGNQIGEDNPHAEMVKATVEWIDLNDQVIKQYRFSKIEQQWILVEINEEDFDALPDMDFYRFYSKFATDEEYQMKHIHNPFYFKTFDYDNDEELKGWVAAEQWPAYRVYIPADKITNILYDNIRAKSNYRTFIISSPSSGMNCNLIFKYVNHRWLLVRMEN